MKLKEKIREGSKVKKVYDKAKTPFERVLECEEISEEDKERLKKTYEDLNPIELKARIDKLQDKLLKMAKREIKEFEKTKNFEYILDEVAYVLLNRKIYEATRLSISLIS